MRVSVIIPTYNRAALVVDAVQSVLNQTVRDTEVIVIDDGSTDDTQQQLAIFSGRIRLVHQANAGVNAARNHGISIAQGEYIALLDNDDLWLDFKLEAQLYLLEKYPEAGFLFTDFIIRKHSGQDIHAGLSTWHTHRPHWRAAMPKCKQVKIPLAGREHLAARVCHGDIYRDSLSAPYVLPSTALIRRCNMDADIRLPEHDPTCGDWEYFSRLSHRHSALYLDCETTINRSHEDAVRLTRLPQSTQVQRRIGMINRTWAADTGFYDDHRGEVDEVRHGLWMQLVWLQLLDGDKKSAELSMWHVSTFNVPGMRLKKAVLRWIILVPGSTVLLGILRRARNFLRMLLVRHQVPSLAASKF